MSGRKTRVEFNGTRSKAFRLDQGLPQGSCISPLLFLIFINDIDVHLHPDTIASLFADDTATWMVDGKIKGSNRTLMQEEIDKILAWASKWKMSVNKGKTKSMIISSSNKDTKWDPQFQAGDTRIKAVNDYPFLGVKVDSDLRFNQHVSKIETKCKKRVNIIKCLSSKDWGNSLETQRALYLTYIRMVLEYASPSWSSWTASSNIQRLQRIQNEALRSVAGLYKTCPQDFLHLETNVKPLKFRYENNDDITWDKYARLPETDQRRQLQLKEVEPRLKTRLGWRHTTSERMSKFKDLSRDTTSPHLPPWKKAGNLKIERVELDKPKNEYTEEELLVISTMKINSLEREITVYTDGSTDGHQEKGGAEVYIHDATHSTILEESYPAGRYCSSYGGECVAMLKALEWLQRNPTPSLICTDSDSLVSALEENNWKDRDPWLKQIKKIIFDYPQEITLLWIPSHCGIEGNDKADELAKKGTEKNQEDIPVTHAIMKAKIKAQSWPLTHTRAEKTYQDLRKPNYKIEKEWPKRVRSLFSRLRTGHAVELKAYRHRI